MMNEHLFSPMWLDVKTYPEITFEVKFIKSTYMKYIIDRSTNFEMNKWLEAFFAHLKKVILVLSYCLCVFFAC